jgi:hypothetical protein
MKTIDRCVFTERIGMRRVGGIDTHGRPHILFVADA